MPASLQDGRRGPGVSAASCLCRTFRDNTEVCNRRQSLLPKSRPAACGSTTLLFFDRRRSAMALMKMDSLLLPVVRVAVRGVVAGLESTGFAQASGQTPEVTLSFARHLLPGDPDTDPNPAPRY